MYKFLGIQSIKDAADEYQPKGDYLSPSQYETKYGKVIEDKFKGYLPIGDYMLNDEAKFRNSKIWPPIQAELDNKYQPKDDYTLNSTFNAYKTSAANTYALASDLNSFKDTVGQTYALASDLNAYRDSLNERITRDDFNEYKTSAANTYALASELNAYRDNLNTLLTRDEFTDYRLKMNDSYNNQQFNIDNIDAKVKVLYSTYKNRFKNDLDIDSEKIDKLFFPPSYLRTRNYMLY